MSKLLFRLLPLRTALFPSLPSEIMDTPEEAGRLFEALIPPRTFSVAAPHYKFRSDDASDKLLVHHFSRWYDVYETGGAGALREHRALFEEEIQRTEGEIESLREKITQYVQARSFDAPEKESNALIAWVSHGCVGFEDAGILPGRQAPTLYRNAPAHVQNLWKKWSDKIRELEQVIDNRKYLINTLDIFIDAIARGVKKAPTYVSPGEAQTAEELRRLKAKKEKEDVEKWRAFMPSALEGDPSRPSKADMTRRDAGSLAFLLSFIDLSLIDPRTRSQFDRQICENDLPDIPNKLYETWADLSYYFVHGKIPSPTERKPSAGSVQTKLNRWLRNAGIKKPQTDAEWRQLGKSLSLALHGTDKAADPTVPRNSERFDFLLCRQKKIDDRRI